MESYRRRRRHRCYANPNLNNDNNNDNNDDIKTRKHSKWGEPEFVHEIIIEGPLEETKVVTRLIIQPNKNEKHIQRIITKSD